MTASRRALIDEEALREMRARAAALELISTAFYEVEGLVREVGCREYLALSWLAEGLAQQVDGLSARWHRDEDGEAGQ